MISMPPTLKKYLRHYVWGLTASTFNGGIMGVGALAVMAEQQKLPEGFTLHVLAHTFGVACAGTALMYFKQHPLPEKLPDEPEPRTPLAVAAPNPPIESPQK